LRLSPAFEHQFFNFQMRVDEYRASKTKRFTAPWWELLLRALIMHNIAILGTTHAVLSLDQTWKWELRSRVKNGWSADKADCLSSAEALVGYEPMITISIEIHFTTLYMADLGTQARARWGPVIRRYTHGYFNTKLLWEGRKCTCWACNFQKFLGWMRMPTELPRERECPIGRLLHLNTCSSPIS
jgi:hypothetical protein